MLSRALSLPWDKSRGAARGCAGPRGDGAGHVNSARGGLPRAARGRAGPRGDGAGPVNSARGRAGPRGDGAGHVNSARGRARPRGDGAGYVNSAWGRAKWRERMARGRAGMARGRAGPRGARKLGARPRGDSAGHVDTARGRKATLAWCCAYPFGIRSGQVIPVLTGGSRRPSTRHCRLPHAPCSRIAHQRPGLQGSRPRHAQQSHCSARGSLTFLTMSAEFFRPRIAAPPCPHPLGPPPSRGPKTPPPSDHCSPPPLEDAGG
jgi:hypothetical protein